MEWTFDEKRAACIAAPFGRDLLWPDTRCIERPGWRQIVTPTAPAGMLNEVALSQVSSADAETVIDEAIALYREFGQPVKWCVGPWTEPADFGERLERRGFRSWDVRGMGCSTSTIVQTTSSAQIHVERVTPATLDEYLVTSHRGWNTPEETLERARQPHLDGVSGSPPNVILFTARFGDEAVGTGGIFVRQAGRAYGYLVGTQVLDHARGRGVYRALVGARLRALRDLGIEYAVTQAREATSAPMLEHLGFETLFRSKCFVLD